MEPKSDGPETPVSDEETSHGERTHVIRGPGGFRVVAETTPDELLSKLGPADRIHVVVYHDSDLDRSVGTVTVVRGEHLPKVDEVCAETDDPFHVAIKKTAYTQVCSQIWGGRPPDDVYPEHVFEISPRELRELMAEEMAHREKIATDAS